MATFDPNNPTAFFSQINNLSPVYTSDPTASTSTLQSLQAAQAWLAANPTALPANQVQEYQAQLVSSIGEQQNIGAYDGSTTSSASDASTASQIGNILKNLSNNTTAGDWQALINYMSKNGINPTINDPLSALSQSLGTDPNAPAIDLLQAALNKGNPNQLLGIFAGEIKNSVGSQIATSLQNTSNTDAATSQTDQNNITSGMTYAQPDYAGMANQISSYYGGPGVNGAAPTGVYATTIVPQEQNYYAQAYQAKNNIAEQENQAGLLNSGRASLNKGSINSQALSADNTLLNAYEGQKAQAKTDLATAQQQGQAAYASSIGAAKGTDLGALLSGAQNSNFAANQTNAATEAQTAVNNNETNIAQSNANNAPLGGLLSGIGGLAGTAVGAMI